MNDLEFFDESTLLARLTSALKKRNREVIFLVGSPLSAPQTPHSLGVPLVDGVIGLIRQEFSDDTSQLIQLDSLISNSKERRYQEAFRFLQSRRGQRVANEIIRSAVLAACQNSARHRASDGDETSCQLLESDDAQWTVSAGGEALARLVVNIPKIFGRAILTTNFDPLIEISISKAGGRHYKTILQGDGNISITSAPGCQIIHLHGYWYGSNTLHTVRQLTQPRPELKASLSRLLRGRLVVVSGYGGWDDIFTTTLLEMIADDTDETEILWTSLSQPTFSKHIEDHIRKAADKGKVFLFSGIDCNVFFPTLANWWGAGVSTIVSLPASSTSPVKFSEAVVASLGNSANAAQVLEGDDEDRPPVVEFCVGREKELELLISSPSKIVFITGIGGQGKSTIAAKAFGERQKARPLDIFVWRDCKEESERFENQLASIIESLTSGKVRGLDLAKQDIHSIIAIMVPLLADRSALFVFDNIEHYIDLESTRLISSVELFVKAIIEQTAGCSVFFTSRPSVQYLHPDVSAIRLEGLTLPAAKTLFVNRGAKTHEKEIQDAHQLTNGHAFWLDLLAIQAAKNDPLLSLQQMVDEIRLGQGELPTNMLQSIWSKLTEKERIVLRAMAETVRPEREHEIAEYLKKDLTFQKVFRTLRALRSANLVVVKRLRLGEEVLELHPLVRSFIRKRFSQKERLSFIDGIVNVYIQFMGKHRAQLADRPTFLILQNWTQAAELSLAAGRLDEAFSTLSESVGAFTSSAYPREFTRVARLVFQSFDFVKEYKNHKQFDSVFQAYVKLLSYLGEFAEADSLLDKYALTLPEKNSRYILYCDLRGYSYWIRKSFPEAVEWGERGRALKLFSKVDSSVDIEHTLALALRDSGDPDAALPTFLAGRSLEEVVNPDEFQEERGGAHYGNIGRCLYLMGDLEGALICYQKSALLLEKDRKHEHILNQGFIRLWVGEVFISRKRFDVGIKFLEAARRKWEIVAPPEARRVALLQEQFENFSAAIRERSQRVESSFQDWIVSKIG